MKSHITADFRKAYSALPNSIRQQARKAYKLFSDNPNHPSLHFKPIHSRQPIYSVRINRDFRAVGIREEDTIIWFWIGSHDDYIKLISRL